MIVENKDDVTMTNVYFIRQDVTGHVKIGMAQDVEKRMRTLQTGSPYPLSILTVIEDVDNDMETELHQLFSPYRMEGEWFRYSKDIENFIKWFHYYQKMGNRTNKIGTMGWFFLWFLKFITGLGATCLSIYIMIRIFHHFLF